MSIEEALRPARLEESRRVSVPVVARGAGTGLSGGAFPLANGVLMGLAKFSRILSIDPENRCAHVQPGVRNLAISEAVAAHGLYYAPTPPRRSPAPSAATWRRTPAACTASSTA
jgi:glycolate oxidase